MSTMGKTDLMSDANYTEVTSGGMSDTKVTAQQYSENGEITCSLFDSHEDIEILKARLRSNSQEEFQNDVSSGGETSEVLVSGNGLTVAQEHCELPELDSLTYKSDASDRSDSLCQSTETLIDHLESTVITHSSDLDSSHEKPSESSTFPIHERSRNLSGPSSTEIQGSNHNEITVATGLHSGLLISPVSLTQDISVDMGADNKRISTVLESLDLQLLYLPNTQQLVAGKKPENKLVADSQNSEVQDNTNGTNVIVENCNVSNGEAPDLAAKPDSLKLSGTDSNSSTPTKMSKSDISQDSKVLTPGSLDDSSSICETDFLIKVKEPDQLTCDSVDFECNFPRINTNDSLLRTFTDASSLSSISTGTDFSVSAASLDEGEGTGFCIDTGDAGFMEINLHSRNSFERTKNPSQDSGFEDRAAKPKRKGIGGFLSRSLFSRKSKENNVEGEDSAPGWKLFGKIPPKQIPSKDPDQVLSEYQEKQRSDQLVASRAKKEDIEVMSTTALILENRPMNLPSKDPEEAERHRQQYEAMVEAARRKEQKEIKQKKKQKQQQIRQEEQQMAAAKTWAGDILPNWETMKSSKKVREMWWNGIPTNVRGKVWKLAFGNDLNITQELYEICVSRAEDRIKQMDESSEVFGSSETSSEPPSSKESSVELIKLDVSRTFPQLCIFQKGGPYHDLLHSLLGAYACYRPDVGYVQGMSFIAAVLLLNMEVADAFICFANLLNRPCQLAFFRLDEGLMKTYFQTFEEFFIENMPCLQKHFSKNSLTPDLYLIDWIFTLFSKSFPLDVACRVWDIFCRDGEEFLFRTAIGVLKMHEEVLMNMDFIHLAQFLTKLPDSFSQDNLFKCIDSVRMNVDKKRFPQILASNRENKDNT